MADKNIDFDFFDSPDGSDGENISPAPVAPKVYIESSSSSKAKSSNNNMKRQEKETLNNAQSNQLDLSQSFECYSDDESETVNFKVSVSNRKKKEAELSDSDSDSKSHSDSDHQHKIKDSANKNNNGSRPNSSNSMRLKPPLPSSGRSSRSDRLSHKHIENSHPLCKDDIKNQNPKARSKHDRHKYDVKSDSSSSDEELEFSKPSRRQRQLPDPKLKLGIKDLVSPRDESNSSDWSTGEGES